MSDYLLEVENVSRYFGSVIALEGVSMNLKAGEVHCLLGDNGAGKSTLIKTLAGVHEPSKGVYRVGGKAVNFKSPRDAMDAGIATVYQDLSMISLMSITRNFFMGRELTKGIWPFRQFDVQRCNDIARDEMKKIGIDVREPEQAAGTLSGGERQSLAIARAVYFGAKVLILDEPTSALGVAQTSQVLRYISQLREQGLGIVFITHNVRHAYAVGDRFTILQRGQTLGTFAREDKARDEIEEMMAGGKVMADLASELGDRASANL